MLTSRPLRSLILAHLCLYSAACGNPEGGGAAPVSSAPAARSAAPGAASAAAPAVEKLPGFDLKGTLGGQPVDFRNAIAYQRPGSDGVEVLVSSAARDCDTPTKNGISLERDEVMFSFVVIEALKPDGKPAWQVAETYFSGSTGLGEGEPAAVERGGAAGPMKISLEPLSLKGAGSEKKLEVQGTVVAKSCGVIPKPGGFQEPAARAQADLTLEVAGQKIGLQGALYREDKKELVLATIPMSCADSPFSQGDVALILDEKYVNLQGRRIGTQYSGSPRPALKLKVGKPADGVVEVAVDGDFKLSDWPVKLKGKASALVCAK